MYCTGPSLKLTAFRRNVDVVMSVWLIDKLRVFVTSMERREGIWMCGKELGRGDDGSMISIGGVGSDTISCNRKAGLINFVGVFNNDVCNCGIGLVDV